MLNKLYFFFSEMCDLYKGAADKQKTTSTTKDTKRYIVEVREGIR